MSNDISNQANDRKVMCPKVRFWRRGCTSWYKYKEVFMDQKKYKTTYEYKYKDFRRQECKNVWQNQCRLAGLEAVRNDCDCSCPQIN